MSAVEVQLMVNNIEAAKLAKGAYLLNFISPNLIVLIALLKLHSNIQCFREYGHMIV